MKGAEKALWRSVALPASLGRALPVIAASAAAAAFFAFNLARGNEPLRTAAGLAGLAWYCVLVLLPRPGPVRRVDYLTDGEAPAGSVALLVAFAFFDAGPAASVSIAFFAVLFFGAFADAAAAPGGNDRTQAGAASMAVAIAAAAVLYLVSGAGGPPHDAVGKAFLGTGAGRGWRISPFILTPALIVPVSVVMHLFRRELLLRAHGRAYYASSMLSYNAIGIIARLLRAAAAAGVLTLSGWLCGSCIPSARGIREMSTAALRLAVMLFLLNWLDFRIVACISAAVSIVVAVAQSRTGRICHDRDQ